MAALVAVGSDLGALGHRTLTEGTYRESRTSRPPLGIALVSQDRHLVRIVSTWQASQPPCTFFPQGLRSSVVHITESRFSSTILHQNGRR